MLRMTEGKGTCVEEFRWTLYLKLKDNYGEHNTIYIYILYTHYIIILALVAYMVL